MRRIVAPAALVIAILAVLCAVWIAVARSYPAPLPAPTGPYNVGRTEFDWRDATRPDPFVPTEKRELDVLLWYPAEEQGAPAPYLRENWRAQLERPFPMPKLDHVQTHAWEGVGLAKPPEHGWPVVILFPGFGALPSDYTVLAEDLASHGYVVAAAAVTHSGADVIFPDRRTGKEISPSPDDDQLVRIWANDVAIVAAKLGELNEKRSPFQHGLDTSRFAVIGHSFGGAAAAQFCATDPRCAAGIDLDGAIYGDAPKQGIRAPFLFLVSDGTNTPFQSSRAKKEWAAAYAQYVAELRATCARSPHCTVEIVPGFRHANFTDSAVLFRAPLVWVHPALGSASRYAGMELLRQRARTFLSENLAPARDQR